MYLGTAHLLDDNSRYYNLAASVTESCGDAIAILKRTLDAIDGVAQSEIDDIREFAAALEAAVPPGPHHLEKINEIRSLRDDAIENVVKNSKRQAAISSNAAVTEVETQQGLKTTDQATHGSRDSQSAAAMNNRGSIRYANAPSNIKQAPQSTGTQGYGQNIVGDPRDETGNLSGAGAADEAGVANGSTATVSQRDPQGSLIGNNPVNEERQGGDPRDTIGQLAGLAPAGWLPRSDTPTQMPRIPVSGPTSSPAPAISPLNGLPMTASSVPGNSLPSTATPLAPAQPAGPAADLSRGLSEGLSSGAPSAPIAPSQPIIHQAPPPPQALTDAAAASTPPASAAPAAAPSAPVQAPTDRIPGPQAAPIIAPPPMPPPNLTPYGSDVPRAPTPPPHHRRHPPSPPPDPRAHATRHRDGRRYGRVRRNSDVSRHAGHLRRRRHRNGRRARQLANQRPATRQSCPPGLRAAPRLTPVPRRPLVRRRSSRPHKEPRPSSRAMTVQGTSRPASSFHEP